MLLNYRFERRLAGLLACLAFAAPVHAQKNSPAAPTIGSNSEDPVENSVVKVFSTIRAPDVFKPWSKQAPEDVTGSGVVIDGKRILSNAHVVNYASEVQIEANQSGDKIPATVVAIDRGIDLALLKVDDADFFKTHRGLGLAKSLPGIKDPVMVYGYPTGGAGLSITKGIVSRIEYVAYNAPASALRIQIDAAINPGNSGGPAVVGDKIIGLAFSYLLNAQNIGYIIPSEEIELFLKDAANGRMNGKPTIYDDLETLENPALRAYLKLDKTVHGALVTKANWTEPDYPLQKWDVITKVGDTALDDEGMVRVGELRLAFSYLLQRTVRDGIVPMTIVRSNRQLSVQVPMKSKYLLVLAGLNGTYPSYFIYGPIVFSTATQDFIGSLMRSGSAANAGWNSVLVTRNSPLLRRATDRQAFDGERLVVVSSPFFPHKLAVGYGNPVGQVVKSVNGIEIRNLGHLVEVLRDSTDEMIRVEYDSRRAETLVFPRQEMLAATEGILSDNGVRSQGSPDTMAIWNAPKKGD